MTTISLDGGKYQITYEDERLTATRCGEPWYDMRGYEMIGVLVLEFEALKAERDRLKYELDAVPAIKAERDALTTDNASLHRQLERWQAIAVERAKERDEYKQRMQRLMTTVLETKKERDAHRTQVEAQNTEISRLKLELDDANERAFMSTESHAMTMQRAMKAEAERDAALEQNTELDARCAKLEAAAKLALDVCLDMRRYGDQRGVAMAIGAEAALRQAGVQ